MSLGNRLQWRLWSALPSNSLQGALMNSIVELIRGIPVPFNMVVLVVFFVSAAGVISNLITQIRKYIGLRQELEFKRDLLDRGLSIEEIERLTRVKSSTISEKDQ
jgi:hypothetical protein